ncbi:hypothetical protein Ga0609869_000702 [Rhodovulum iodosum]|uniref:YjbH domain-containing protein n=1 Tax=Rhodovulum iodosum TaxID=68291 RepID=A0ABV3XPV8_9RHOB|nr:YjbH domain-containing protein [Rhodovulum robiginosum]RSK31371.1 YjbH domain-containing protein [Rhodovulum robiginosum]
MGRIRRDRNIPARGLGVSALALWLAAGPALAQSQDTAWNTPSLNFNGVTGLIDMPSGEAQPDGQVSLTFGYFGGMSRTTLHFQLAPRLSGAFRYSGTRDWGDVVDSNFDTYFDRSFDMRLLLLKERRYVPAVTLGFQDFVGTGLFSGEYIAATKELLPGLKVTGGLGWGRLGSYNDIGTPFGDRPEIDIGEGGNVNNTQWFRGPAAPFGGIEWQINERFTLKAEYSSDAYVEEAGRREVFERESPFNFGVDYKVNESLRVGAYSLYGSELGVMASITLNPKRPPNRGIFGPAPTPVERRPALSADPEAWSEEWITQDGVTEILRRNMRKQLEADSLELESIALSGDAVELRFRNLRYDSSAQAIGRVARALTRVMPASVETFRIVPVVDGVPAAAVTLRRTDVEQLEHAPNGAAAIRSLAGLGDAGPMRRGSYAEGLYPKFDWALGPYLRTSYFDPDEPVRADLGLRLQGSYEMSPGVVLSGSVSGRLVGNLGDSDQESNSELPKVRSNAAEYNRQTDVGLDRLTAAYYFKPGRDLYGRVTAGYLERMFGGISGEVLWRPVDSRLGLGAEVNYAKQRDFDGGFGFQDYDVFTGHVSAYYDLGSDYQVQIDMGRYLAGDYGATFTVDREFDNGWRIGAFATFTDVSAEEFGEGSFDKGIRLQIPLAWFTGTPTRERYSTVVRPLSRDGGARLRVDGRLNEKIRDYHRDRLDAQWGRFWR